MTAHVPQAEEQQQRCQHASGDDSSQEPHPFGPTNGVVPGQGGPASTREPGKCGTQAPGRHVKDSRKGERGDVGQE